MSAHLSDKTKKKIIADRLDGLSYRALAEKYKVSRYAIECAVKSDPQFSQKMEQKKDENTRDMLEYLENRKTRAMQIVDKLLNAMEEPETLAKASERDLATALGIVIDKFTKTGPEKKDSGVMIVWGRKS